MTYSIPSHDYHFITSQHNTSIMAHHTHHTSSHPSWLSSIIVECSALLGFEIVCVFFSPSSTSTFPQHQHLSPCICSSLHHVRSLLLNISKSQSPLSIFFFFNFSVCRTFPSYLVSHSSMLSSYSIYLFTTLALLLLFDFWASWPA